MDPYAWSWNPEALLLVPLLTAAYFLALRRYPASPLVQIIRVIEIAKDGRYEIDYWCDVCSIAMYELKECECCQGPIELRRNKVQ